MAPRASSRSRGKSPQVAATPRSARKSRGLAGERQNPLPLIHASELLKNSRVKVHPVKQQTLHLESEDILIYRQKVPTPKGISGHIIRRTDTDAVSASSLFRCAFPTASTKQEEDEMEHLTEKYDTVAAGRETEPDNKGRLTGKWVPTSDARVLAEEYGLLKFAVDLFDYAGEDSAGPVTDSSMVDIVNGENGTNAVETTPPPRASKRQRLQSPPSAPKSPGVTVVQSISTDSVTGASVETTKVTIETPEHVFTDHASQEQKSLEAIASAKELVEQLKEQHVLATLPGDAPAGRKRGHEDIDAMQPTIRRDWFGRKAVVRPIAGAAVTTRRAPPESRRLFAYAGLAIVGAATAVAPYFL